MKLLREVIIFEVVTVTSENLSCSTSLLLNAVSLYVLWDSTYVHK